MLHRHDSCRQYDSKYFRNVHINVLNNNIINNKYRRFELSRIILANLILFFDVTSP